MLAAGDEEAGAHQVIPGASAAHPGAEFGIIIAVATTDRADDRHDFPRAVGEIDAEPVAEEGRDFVGQADRDEGCGSRARCGGFREDRFGFVVGDGGDEG